MKEKRRLSKSARPDRLQESIEEERAQQISEGHGADITEEEVNSIAQLELPNHKRCSDILFDHLMLPLPV